jgi:hypothetical protein
MAIRSVVRHTGAARSLAHAEAREALLLDQLAGRGQDGRAQVAVVICCQ